MKNKHSEEERQKDPNAGYRPTVMWLAGMVLNQKGPGIVRAGIVLGAVPILFVPTRVRWYILFRTRNEQTWKIAKNIPGHIHFDSSQ